MNDLDQPTATTFSDLAGSESAQTAFFKSLVNFMSTYGFDGVDIDWEYPVAPERGGQAADFANYVSFLKNLRRTSTTICTIPMQIIRMHATNFTTRFAMTSHRMSGAHSSTTAACAQVRALPSAKSWPASGGRCHLATAKAYSASTTATAGTSSSGCRAANNMG